jgi:hypothetical protein
MRGRNHLFYQEMGFRGVEDVPDGGMRLDPRSGDRGYGERIRTLAAESQKSCDFSYVETEKNGNN